MKEEIPDEGKRKRGPYILFYSLLFYYYVLLIVLHSDVIDWKEGRKG